VTTVVSIGAGAMGAVAARTAAAQPAVRQLVVADLVASRAEQLASAIAGRGAAVTAAQADVLDPVALRALLADADAVINTSGPFSRMGTAVLSAAIATGTHYLDICDDPQPTQDMLALDQPARDAGVIAVVGIGASPGISNLLAARAARGMDTIDALYTAWPVDVPADRVLDPAELTGADGKPSAAIVHWLEQLHGRIPVVEGGALVQRPPLRAVTLDTPGGLHGTGYTVGHPEPVTLHGVLPVTGEAACLMMIQPRTAGYLMALSAALDAGRLDLAAAARAVVTPRLRYLLPGLLRGRRLRGHGSLPPFFAYAAGHQDGQPVTRIVQAGGDASMAEATGVPLGFALGQVLDGIITAPGVHPPEAVVDGDRLIAALLASDTGTWTLDEATSP
jgi:lysine 6-dehydrogenase